MKKFFREVYYFAGYFISYWRRSSVFIVNFEHILYLFLVFLLLTLDK